MVRGRLFDPRQATASQRHVELYIRYRQVYEVLDILAALAFVAGSILFLWRSTNTPALWLFIGGSILFMGVPVTSVLQAVHLRRLPVPERDVPNQG